MKKFLIKKENFISYLIINIPFFLFLIVAILFLLLSILLKKILFLFGVWWALSGAIMLEIDFLKRKKKNFLRLLILFQKRKENEKLKNNLKQTLCGLSVLWALKYRLNKKPI